MIVSVFLIVLSVLCPEILAQAGDKCETPLNEYGTCINLLNCELLLGLLKAQGDNPEVRSYLQRSACGFSGSNPLVCCPMIKTKSSTTRVVFPDENTTFKPARETHFPSYTLPSPPECGLSNVSTGRIVNGIPAKLGEYPWIVALGYKNAKNLANPKWLCGGSMITKRHVLTAAHCVYNRKDLYLARLGELDLFSEDDGAQTTDINIAERKIHENYSPATYTNDIAILKLEYEHNNPTVWPVCLPISDSLRSNQFVKYNPFVAGWGAIYFNGPSSPSLQTTMLPVVSNDQCKRAFASFKTTIIDDRVLCAGFLRGGKDACQGDSGGPLMYGKFEKQVKFYQIGIVSYGFRCAEEGYPGVYTRVTAFLDWITRNID